MENVKTNWHETLGGIGLQEIGGLLAAAADLILIIDEAARITRVVAGAELQAYDLADAWHGRPWVETLVPESQAVALELVERDASARPTLGWQEVTHALPDGGELPLSYRVTECQSGHCRIAVGRDLRAVAALQQQVLNAQLALEQDNWRLRQLETRYRLLFEMSGDGVLVVDEASGKVMEANPQAAQMLGDGGQILGRAFPLGFAGTAQGLAQQALAEARAVGRAQLDDLPLSGDEGPVDMTVHLLRQNTEARFLIRLTHRETALPPRGDDELPSLDETLLDAADAIALTDLDGRTLAVNRTFLTLTQLVSAEQAGGELIGRWLGRTGVDLNVLLSNLRQRQVVRLFATTLRTEFGASIEVEVSAHRFVAHGHELFAFFIRDIGRRVGVDNPETQRLPRSVEQLTQQVGRVPLKELVRESSDIIEKLCIEAALRLTGDNRASAAELLGLSRQSLYAKLHRYKLSGSNNNSD